MTSRKKLITVPFCDPGVRFATGNPLAVLLGVMDCNARSG